MHLTQIYDKVFFLISYLVPILNDIMVTLALFITPVLPLTFNEASFTNQIEVVQVGHG